MWGVAVRLACPDGHHREDADPRDISRKCENFDESQQPLPHNQRSHLRMSQQTVFAVTDRSFALSNMRGPTELWRRPAQGPRLRRKLSTPSTGLPEARLPPEVERATGGRVDTSDRWSLGIASD